MLFNPKSQAIKKLKLWRASAFLIIGNPFSNFQIFKFLN
jgi:hypothetical protein